MARFTNNRYSVGYTGTTERQFILSLPHAQDIIDAMDQFILEQQIDELIAREEYREWIEYNWIDDNPYCQPSE